MIDTKYDIIISKLIINWFLNVFYVLAVAILLILTFKDLKVSILSIIEKIE